MREKSLELQAEAIERAEALRSVVAELSGLSHRAAAKALNERGIKTTTGKARTAVQVTRVRERLGPTSVGGAGATARPADLDKPGANRVD